MYYYSVRCITLCHVITLSIQSPPNIKVYIATLRDAGLRKVGHKQVWGNTRLSFVQFKSIHHTDHGPVENYSQKRLFSVIVSNQIPNEPGSVHVSSPYHTRVWTSPLQRTINVA